MVAGVVGSGLYVHAKSMQVMCDKLPACLVRCVMRLDSGSEVGPMDDYGAKLVILFTPFIVMVAIGLVLELWLLVGMAGVYRFCAAGGMRDD